MTRRKLTYNAEAGFPRVVIEVKYLDVAAAIEWLSRCFGFVELLRHQNASGFIAHVDMDIEGGHVMLGSTRHLGTRGDSDDHQILVQVADVDAHHAVAAGADVSGPPEDRMWGLRSYRVRDLENHLWEFASFVRDVPPKEWGATVPDD